MMTLLFCHVSAWYLISEIPWKPLKCPTSYSALYMPVGKHAVCCRQWWPRSGTGSIYGIGTTTLRRSWFVAWRLRTREFWRHSNHLISQILQFCQNCTICWASRGQIYLIWNDSFFYDTPRNRVLIKSCLVCMVSHEINKIPVDWITQL